jgi:hypothetical protein
MSASIHVKHKFQNMVFTFSLSFKYYNKKSSCIKDY